MSTKCKQGIKKQLAVKPARYFSKSNIEVENQIRNTLNELEMYLLE